MKICLYDLIKSKIIIYFYFFRVIEAWQSPNTSDLEQNKHSDRRDCFKTYFHNLFHKASFQMISDEKELFGILLFQCELSCILFLLIDYVFLKNKPERIPQKAFLLRKIKELVSKLFLH